jgi:hypothetical protein
MITCVERVDASGSPIEPTSTGMFLICSAPVDNKMEELKRLGEVLSDGSEITIGALTISFRIEVRKKAEVSNPYFLRDIAVKNGSMNACIIISQFFFFRAKNAKSE